MRMTQGLVTGLIVVGWVVGIAGPVEAKLKKGPWPADPGLAKVQEQIKEAEKKCDGIKPFLLAIECTSKVKREFLAKGLVRGTMEYADLHYVDLPTPELKAKLQELRALRDRARTRVEAEFDRGADELVVEDFFSEILRVETELVKRRGMNTKRNLDFIQGKGGTTLP